MFRTWAVRLPAIEFTLSVRSFQVPPTPFTWAWPPSLPSVPTSRATAGHFRGEGVELVHHGVDGVLELQDFALHVDRDLLVELAPGDGRGHLGDVSHLGREVAGHRVHVVGQVFQVPPTPFTWAWPPSLPSVPTFAGHPGHFRGEGVELVHHGVDGVLELQDFALDVDRDLLVELAPGDGRGYLGDVSGPGP
jgi:hypothetical protein